MSSLWGFKPIEIVVGDGNLRGTIPTIVFNSSNISSFPEFTISENRRFYWVNMKFFHAKLSIQKNTSEGKRLAKLLNSKERSLTGPDSIPEFLTGIVLKNINPESFLVILDKIKKEEYDNGIESAKMQLRKWLQVPRD